MTTEQKIIRAGRRPTFTPSRQR